MHGGAWKHSGGAGVGAYGGKNPKGKGEGEAVLDALLWIGREELAGATRSRDLHGIDEEDEGREHDPDGSNRSRSGKKKKPSGTKFWVGESTL